MKRKKPSFNETYYGFRSFSSLLEDAQRRGVVTLRRDQKSGSYIVEDLGAAARGDGSIVPPRASEIEAVAASVPPSESGSNGNGNGNGSSNGNGHGGYRNEPRSDREPRGERRPSAPMPPIVAASTLTAPPVPGSTGVPSVSAATGPDEVLIGTEVETPDGEAPSRPRRRRGGRGRGRGREGREGGERESRPDLEARGEDVPLPLEEDSNPSIPTVPEAAAAYKEVGERMSATNAPVFTEAPVSDVSSDARAVPAERARRTESVDGEEPDEVEPVTVAVAATPAPRPAPPVAPVDPSKASFSLLGWLKGGG